MIGLVDYALQTSASEKILIPNLEIMKLATYYRTEENIFCRLVDLNETNLSGYDRIYFFCEDNIQPNVPGAFRQAQNVIFGGTAFTNGVYIPFENEIIDFTIPRLSIYKEFLKQKYQDGVQTKVINRMLDDAYYRNYAGSNKLPITPMHPKKRIFLYDKNFFYPDWEETIDKIVKRKPSSIVRIHPIVCNTLTQYFTLRSKDKILRGTNIILDLNIPLKDVNYMIKNYKNLFLADITSASNVFITLGGSFQSSYHYYNDYIYKINLLYSFWTAGILLKIKYETPKIGYIDPISNLSKLTERWACGENKFRKTLEQKFPKRKLKADVIIEEEEMKTILKFHPSAKDLFNQTFDNLKKGGYWRV